MNRRVSSRLFLLIIIAFVVIEGRAIYFVHHPSTGLKGLLAQFIGTDNFTITKSFTTGFESVNDFAGFYITPQNYTGSSHNLVADNVHGGIYSHKAWIYGVNPVVPYTNTNHRAYPTIQLYKTANGTFRGIVLTELWVWLDMTLVPHATGDNDWFSFATISTYSDDGWPRVVLVNLNVDGFVQLMHVPNMEQQITDIYQTTSIPFPKKQWVKLDILTDFTSNNQYASPYVKVWQNDILVSGARFNPRLDVSAVNSSLLPPCASSWNGVDISVLEKLCSLVYTGGYAQAHFGLYAHPLIASGTVYNDDLKIYEIEKR